MKLNLKKIKCIILIIIVMSITLGVSINSRAEDAPIKILLNNKIVESDQEPVIINGRTFVPIATIAKAMGCEVIWLDKIKTANIKNDTTILSLEIGKKQVTKLKRNNPEQKQIIEADEATCIIGSRTCVPVRVVAECFGGLVGWDAENRTVMIVYDTTLNYLGNKTIENYAGNTERKIHDSDLEKMSFLSPESIDISKDGSIYIVDSGVLRKIKNGKSETVEFEPKYITADVVRCFGDDVYILTNEFENEEGVKYYGIVKLKNGVAEGIYVTEAVYSKITDFDFSDDGKMYILQNNVGVGKNYIGVLDKDKSDIQIISEVDNGIKSLTVDKKGNLYLANTVKGSIYYFSTSEKKIRLFAGVDNKTKFVDGPDPFLFEPRKVKYFNDCLYILDYNILRRIHINDSDLPIYSETLGGKVTVDQNPETSLGKASESTIAPSYLMDFIVDGENIYITDPKKGLVRVIK